MDEEVTKKEDIGEIKNNIKKGNANWEWRWYWNLNLYVKDIIYKNREKIDGI